MSGMCRYMTVRLAVPAASSSSSMLSSRRQRFGLDGVMVASRMPNHAGVGRHASSSPASIMQNS